MTDVENCTMCTKDNLKTVFERSYLIWLWLFEHPDKFIQDTPVWKLLRFDVIDELSCVVFELEGEKAICESGCPMYSYRPTCVGGIFLRVFNRNNLKYYLNRHSRKGVAAHIAYIIRKLLMREYPDSEVLPV